MTTTMEKKTKRTKRPRNYIYRIGFLLIKKAGDVPYYSESANIEWDCEIYSDKQLKRMQRYIHLIRKLPTNTRVYVRYTHLLFKKK